MGSSESMMDTPKVPMHRLLLLVFVVGVGGLVLALVFSRLSHRRLTFKACFHQVNELRPGATVRMAGADIGFVQSIEERAGNPGCPVQVTMTADTSSKLKIPADAVASLVKEGPKPRAVEIDLKGTSGPPIQENGFLKSRESEIGGGEHPSPNGQPRHR